MSIFVDFHILQTVPPSCVNRDDMGSPKTAIYDGAVRARVSSQAWKHAMRDEFKKLFGEEKLGSRTKNVVEMVESEMLLIDSSINSEECHKKAVEALKLAGIVKSSKKGESEKAGALFFMSRKQAETIAEHALSLDLKAKESKEILKNDLKENPSVDIALFGRMAAGDPTLNYDAAAQVAHAISTHAVHSEYDYFTAVDNLQKDDNSGAGHLGTVEFNSSTLYRYATVNVSELEKTLGKETVAETVKKFGQAFICSMPTGKENSFANRTFPDTVYIALRKDQPVNLCGAFESPIKKNDNGYARISEMKLAEYAEKIYSRFAAKPVKSFCIGENFGEDTIILPLTERYYLSDAVFLAALESDNRKYLEDIVMALNNPVYPLFLGRRSCPPTLPLVIGITDESLLEALKNAEPLAESKNGYRRIVYESDDSGTFVQDVPVSFSQFHKIHSFRFKKEIMLIDEENYIKEHDPMSEL